MQHCWTTRWPAAMARSVLMEFHLHKRTKQRVMCRPRWFHCYSKYFYYCANRMARREKYRKLDLFAYQMSCFFFFIPLAIGHSSYVLMTVRFPIFLAMQILHNHLESRLIRSVRIRCNEILEIYYILHIWMAIGEELALRFDQRWRPSTSTLQPIAMRQPKKKLVFIQHTFDACSPRPILSAINMTAVWRNARRKTGSIRASSPCIGINSINVNG